MRCLKAMVGRVVAGLTLGVVGMGNAMAQFPQTADQNVDVLLGSDDANTGIYEIESIVPIGLGVAIAVTVAFVGFYMVRALIRRIRG